MTLTADEIVDRRRLRRKLSFWRVIAFLAVAIIARRRHRGAVGRDGISGLSGRRSRA